MWIVRKGGCVDGEERWMVRKGGCVGGEERWVCG